MHVECGGSGTSMWISVGVNIRVWISDMAVDRCVYRWVLISKGWIWLVMGVDTARSRCWVWMSMSMDIVGCGY